MSFDARTLNELLPSILRLRDREMALTTPGMLATRDRPALARLLRQQSPTAAETVLRTTIDTASKAGPLGSLLALLAEQLAILEEDLEQLYDDQFIETCADWIAPYIGDLVGYRVLSGAEPRIASPRAEVARTIAYRRRKGTAPVLEQIAADVTGWKASATEFFARLVVGQHINHPRPNCHVAPDLRQGSARALSGSGFDPTCRSVDVRSIRNGRGRYNIRNVGLFLWRINAYPLRRSSAARVDDLRWRFHPLGLDQSLYTAPQAEHEIGQSASPLTVPMPISRRRLAAQMADYYGSETLPRSLRLYEDSAGSFKLVPAGAIRVADLSDTANGWSHAPAAGRYAVDPVLGRIALPPDLRVGTKVEVGFHYGFSGDLGGGEYERASSIAARDPATRLVRVPGDRATIAGALEAIGGAGIVEIGDSRRYEEVIAINVAAGQSIELRAANRCRPTLALTAPMTIAGGGNANIRLHGLLIAGHAIELPDGQNALRRLEIRHCTLVPGYTLAPDGTPLAPQAASLIARLASFDVVIERSIVGALRTNERSNVYIAGSVVDATAPTHVAYAAPDGAGPGGALALDACTVIGKVHARTLPLVMNTIIAAGLADNDAWSSPVIAERRQEGCLRFSSLPPEARTPPRFHCLPEAAATPEQAAVRFTSLRYGTPGYAQLSRAAGTLLRRGAEDEGQPGAFHFLHEPQREANLRVRLEEYLRVGLEAGIFYES